MQLKRGIFLAFEGIDGAGKTIHAFDLKRRLEAEGVATVYVKEPTNGGWGMEIRRIAAEGRAHVTPEEELEFFIRDRTEDVRENIAPALARGQAVIADRYFYSTIAYQSALGLDESMIRARNAGFPVPDLVFLLEIPLDVSLIRITEHRGEQANLGYEQTAFLARVKEVFDRLEDPNILRVDGARSREAVAEEIWVETRKLLARLKA